MKHTGLITIVKSAVKWVLPLYLFTFLPLNASAQVSYGYLSYERAICAMPEYADMQSNIEQLREQYANETKRAEEEFNKKYEEFLEGQTTFAPAIYSKRQSELQELMEKNIAFKQEARRLLNSAEAAAIKPLKERLNGAIEKIAKERGFAFVLNTDGDACPYINPAMGVNIEDEVINNLNVTR